MSNNTGQITPRVQRKVATLMYNELKGFGTSSDFKKQYNDAYDNGDYSTAIEVIFDYIREHYAGEHQYFYSKFILLVSSEEQLLKYEKQTSVIKRFVLYAFFTAILLVVRSTNADEDDNTNINIFNRDTSSDTTLIWLDNRGEVSKAANNEQRH